MRRIRAIPVDRLVFVDESGVHAAMSRSHTWVKRGTEFIDPVPMHGGKTLTSLGSFGPGFFGHSLDENSRQYVRRTNA